MSENKQEILFPISMLYLLDSERENGDIVIVKESVKSMCQLLGIDYKKRHST